MGKIVKPKGPTGYLGAHKNEQNLRQGHVKMPIPKGPAMPKASGGSKMPRSLC